MNYFIKSLFLELRKKTIKCVLTTADTRNQAPPKKRAKKIVRLTTGNNDLLKNIDFVTLQESEK